MRASSDAAEKASATLEPKPDSPGLSQLKESIETVDDQVDGQVDEILDQEEQEEAEPDTPAEGSVTQESIRKPSPVEPEKRADPSPAPPSPAPPCAAVQAWAEGLVEVDYDIELCAERIVGHSVRISELDAELKAQKKSWKTAADEQVKLLAQRAAIVLDIEKKNKAFAESVKPAAEVSEVAAEKTSPEKTSPPAGPVESTEAHAERMKEAFAPAPGPSDNGEWRSVKLADLRGVPPKALEILVGNNILTMGDFADVPAKKNIEYTQLAHAGAKLTEARFAKVQDAMNAYWKEHPVVTKMEVISETVTVVEKPFLAEGVEDI